MSHKHVPNADFHVDTGSLSTRTLSGIVVGSLSGVSLILFVLWRKGFLGGKCIEVTGERYDT